MYKILHFATWLVAQFCILHFHKYKVKIRRWASDVTTYNLADSEPFYSRGEIYFQKEAHLKYVAAAEFNRKFESRLVSKYFPQQSFKSESRHLSTRHLSATVICLPTGPCCLQEVDKQVGKFLAILAAHLKHQFHHWAYHGSKSKEGNLLYST